MIRFGSRVDVYLPEGGRAAGRRRQTAPKPARPCWPISRHRAGAGLSGSAEAEEPAVEPRHPGTAQRPYPDRPDICRSSLRTRTNGTIPALPPSAGMTPGGGFLGRVPATKAHHSTTPPAAAPSPTHRAPQRCRSASSCRTSSRCSRSRPGSPASGWRSRAGSKGARRPQVIAARSSTASTAGSRASSRAPRASAPNSTASPTS